MSPTPNRKLYLVSGVLGLCLAFSGCVTHRVSSDPGPLIDAPAEFSIPTNGSALVDVPWWTVFDDPVLNGLVESALADNLDLAAGQTRIERAEALVGRARSLRLPQVAFESSAERVRIENQRGRDDESISSFSAGGLLSWELDLWGRLRAVEGSQRQTLEALVYDYEALRLSLSALVAEVYFQIVEQNLRRELLERQRDLANEFLDLLELRFLQGDASSVDVLQQRDRVAEIESQMPVVQARLGELENRLDVLTGQVSDGQPRIAGPAALPADSFSPPTGVPAELLVARPDLKSLQRAVVAQDYEVAAAVANRLPRIALDGSTVYTDATGGADLTQSLAAGLLQPLIDWGLRRSELEAARATFREALLDFSAAYLRAIEEVETTLWQEIQQRDLITALLRREDILDKTVEQTRVRYSLGVTDYLPVLTALQNQQEVQRQILAERLALVLLRVQLYRAIGAPTSAPESGLSRKLEVSGGSVTIGAGAP